MEHLAMCGLCGWRESWTTELAAQAAAVWHIFDEHHDVWVERIGTPERLPVKGMAEDYGRRLEPWESQA